MMVAELNIFLSVCYEMFVDACSNMHQMIATIVASGECL